MGQTTRPTAAMNATLARRPRPRRPAPPALPAGAALDESHRRIVQVLDQLNELIELLPQPGMQATAARLAAAACRYFNGPARAHHEAEETQVFPSLLAHGDASLREQVQRLQQDHNWLEEDWLELEPHLQAVAQGHGPGELDFLHPALLEFTSLYREHMAVEEALLHP